MEKKPPLLILTGPTAVGKTALSIALAREVQGEIISAIRCRCTVIWTSVLQRSGRRDVRRSTLPD